MSRYKAYPEYRDSGVEWLGNIPCDWDCVRLKFASELSGEKVAPSESERYVGLENVQSNSGKFISTEEITPEGISNAFSYGDVLFGKLRPYLAKSWLADFSGICSSEFLVMTSRKVDSKFLHYFTLTEEFIKQVDSSTYGSKMPRASWEFIGLLNIPVPCYESEKIAAFLDHETAKIDALIEKQQRLIELLKEKRQAVISHAVTKGLNPNAPMKYSGVEWLGEVPAHWGITQIKYVAELNPRRALVELKPSLECNFVPMEKLKTESLLLDEIRTVDEVTSGYTCFCDEDILMAKVTPCFENKNIAVARGLKNGVGFGSTEIYVLRTVKHVSNSFLLYRLQENEFMRMATGSMTGAGGLKRVPTDFVNSFKFAIPPIPEQLDICSFIEKQKNRYDTLESLARNQVELLQERRTALISAAVTGKIDVRDWQAAA